MTLEFLANWSALEVIMGFILIGLPAFVLFIVLLEMMFSILVGMVIYTMDWVRDLVGEYNSERAVTTAGAEGGK